MVGGGVIGSLYAAHLARVTDVWMLTRREEHAEALRRHGLHVTGKNDFVATLSAAADPADLPTFDLGILATKATQLAGGMGTVSGAVLGAGFITFLQEFLRGCGAHPSILVSST